MKFRLLEWDEDEIEYDDRSRSDYWDEDLIAMLPDGEGTIIADLMNNTSTNDLYKIWRNYCFTQYTPEQQEVLEHDLELTKAEIENMTLDRQEECIDWMLDEIIDSKYFEEYKEDYLDEHWRELASKLERDWDDEKAYRNMVRNIR